MPHAWQASPRAEFSHSDHEDAQLLPLARVVLTPEDDEILLAEYERLERRHLRAGERTPTERAQQIIERAKQQVLERQPSLLSQPSERTARQSPRAVRPDLHVMFSRAWLKWMLLCSSERRTVALACRSTSAPRLLAAS